MLITEVVNTLHFYNVIYTHNVFELNFYLTLIFSHLKLALFVKNYTTYTTYNKLLMI